MSPTAVLKPTAARLMRRRFDIGDGINPGYGGRAVRVLIGLLQDVITTATANVSKGGDKIASDTAAANAEKIAAVHDKFAC
ncbi:hypothetical protein [Phaeovulum sp.]|uniref:hypothetical protein n=1 Tax=Phaeovulum sp. TaxID=2934796 RepID=UPI0039E2718E